MSVAIELFPEDKLNSDTWSKWTKQISLRTGIKGKNLFLPLRLAITGKNYGPEFSHLIPMIGRAKILHRLSGKEA